MNQTVRLGDVAFVNPKGPRAAEVNPEQLCDFVSMQALHGDGRIEIEEARPFRQVANGYTPFRSGDVLVAKITSCFENGKIALAETKTEYAFGSTEFHVVRGRDGVLDPRYLLHFLRLERIRAEGEGRMRCSAGQKRIPRSFLDDLEIPLPKIAEQQRITAILDKAGDIGRKREQALALADEIVRSTFLQEFGHPLDPSGRLERSELGVYCDLFAGNSLPKGKAFTGQDDGVFLVKVADLSAPGNEVSVQSAKLWAPSRSAVRGGVLAPRAAVVFPKRGGAIATNNKRILGRDSILDPNLMAVAPKAYSHISNQYLRTWFELIDLTSISSGRSIPQLNKKDLALLPFGIPDRKAVEWFNEVYSFVDKLKTRLRVALKEADMMFASLSHSAFRGEL
ncbi:MAG: restriction endonuclease subunit S [Albidovulum sp.]|nr:restriction endonuclease subunit S [Albidovulum sp.]